MDQPKKIEKLDVSEEAQQIRLERRLLLVDGLGNYQLSRGEIYVANFIPPCEWCKSGNLFSVKKKSKYVFLRALTSL